MLKRPAVGFATKDEEDGLFDIIHDFDIIAASFASQYGIRLAIEDIGFAEFASLLSGIMPDTPLGLLVEKRQKDQLKTASQLQKDLQDILKQK